MISPQIITTIHVLTFVQSSIELTIKGLWSHSDIKVSTSTQMLFSRVLFSVVNGAALVCATGDSFAPNTLIAQPLSGVRADSTDAQPSVNATGVDVTDAQLRVIERVAELGFLIVNMEYQRYDLFKPEAVKEMERARELYLWRDSREDSEENMKKLIQEHFGYRLKKTPYLKFALKGGLELYEDAKKGVPGNENEILNFLESLVRNESKCGQEELGQDVCGDRQYYAVVAAAARFGVDAGYLGYTPHAKEEDLPKRADS